MRKSSSHDESTIQKQFDRICKMALKGEAVDYHRHTAYRSRHEVMMSEMDLGRLFTVDEYGAENQWFQVLGYDIEVRDTLIAEALQALSEKKRDVILLSYFMDMSDAEIGRALNLVRSTVREHRMRSLELLRNIMEEHMDEEKKQTGKEC